MVIFKDRYSGLARYRWRACSKTIPASASFLTATNASRGTDEVLCTLSSPPCTRGRCFVAIRSGSVVARAAAICAHWITLSVWISGVLVVGGIHEKGISSVQGREIVEIPIKFFCRTISERPRRATKRKDSYLRLSGVFDVGSPGSR